MTKCNRRGRYACSRSGKIDTPAAKDVTTPEEFEKVRFYGEDIINEWREPAGEFARKILK